MVCSWDLSLVPEKLYNTMVFKSCPNPQTFILKRRQKILSDTEEMDEFTVTMFSSLQSLSDRNSEFELEDTRSAQEQNVPELTSP